MSETYSAQIVGLGSYLPEKVLSNSDLAKMVDTSDEWIFSRTGIKERRIAQEGVAASDLGAGAALRALEKAGIGPEDIDLIIVATATPDMFFPSTACCIQKKIGARNAACFDLSAACSGFIYSLSVAHQFIKTGYYKNILLIGSEKFSSITDWEDRNTCVLFGDGAGAAVVSRGEPGRGIIDTIIGADGTAGDLLYIPGGGSRMPASVETVRDKQHFIKMDGREVYKYAVLAMTGVIESILEQCKIAPDDIGLLVTHQANMRIIKAIQKRLKLPDEKVFVNLHKYGNISAASILVALDEAVQEGRINDGDIVVLAAFGGGFTWGAAALRW